MAQSPAKSALEPWTHRLGILAWAPRTGAVAAEKRRMHPCILYPSWALAMTCGIITDSNAGTDDPNSNEIRLIGCKRSIAVRDLSRNRVPSRLALGSGKNGSKYRPKIVAHFLGLGGEPSWGAVKVESVRQYTLESCEKQCREMNWSDGTQVQVPSGDEILFLAMQEASIVMSRPQFDPVNICKSMTQNNVKRIEENQKPSGTNGHDVTGADEVEAKDEEEQDMTPENFDEWRIGENTQRNTQSQTQNFSQGLPSTIGQMASVKN